MGIASRIDGGEVAFAIFDTDADTKITAQYYPAYVGEKHTKNNLDLATNAIITGPNAAGKTTILKTTALNVIMTQQFGVGFYKACVLNPYTQIHSYLNIPDTSGRDSLFQAESRRCKEIIDEVEKKGGRHFCMFDELYSGTNPSEATKSAVALLQFLSKRDNVDFMLTTHYTGICKKMRENPRISNYKMEVIEQPLKYTYRMKRGISKIKGAILVLEDMKYPAEILDAIR
jgi:DNA mismatch repair ATPase MutS